MSFWSGLAKLGAGIAAPFTGGATLAALPAIDAIGKVATGAAAGAASSREAQNQRDMEYWRAQLEGQRAAAKLEMQQKEWNLKAPGMRMGEVGRADLLRNVQDFSFGPMAGDDVEGSARAAAWTTHGGIRPSALGDDTKEAARLVIAQQLQALQNGPDTFTQMAIPEMPKQRKTGFWEKLAGGAGLVGGIIGGVPAIGAAGKAAATPGVSTPSPYRTPPFVAPSTQSPFRSNPFGGINFGGG